MRPRRRTPPWSSWRAASSGLSHREGSLAAEHAASRLIAVDPVDDAARSFCLRRGFRAVEGDPGGRLFVRTRDALASFPADYGGDPA